jgi:hypothetical protein
VAASSSLNKEGFGYDLLARYKKSGWLEPFGRGAYVLPGDRVEWAGAVYALQEQLHLNVHPGGKTALELQGYAHYLRAEKRKIFLYAEPALVLPSWFRGERLGVEFFVTRTRLFPPATGEGFSELRDREFSVRMSAPERAALEMLHLVPRAVGFDEALLIMENLVSLRPGVVQKLLEICCFVKVKRLFMYMAERHGHPWAEQLDLSKVYFGKGKRLVVAGGSLDRKYGITVPRETGGAGE